MNRAENSDSIPIDLILQILSRLPAKSVGRFHCVSKLWRSMLRLPHFTELFLTRSSARPRLLFALEKGRVEMSFYSSPQPQIPYDKSDLVVAADFHTMFPAATCVYASGLVLLSLENYTDHAMPVIGNPITGQFASLPKVMIFSKTEIFLVFDPIEKQFKLLAESSYPFSYHKVLTLGAGKLGWWSKIKSPSYLFSYSEGICINEVLYYLAEDKDVGGVIVCCDVRYEEFKIIDGEGFCDQYPTTLVNYKGKLGGISWKRAGAIELRVWVLQDVEKHEWSNYVYTLPENEVDYVSIVGMTVTGEIVFSEEETRPSIPFYLFYFHPERNTLQRVEIQGFGENCARVKVFLDHFEDLNFLKNI